MLSPQAYARLQGFLHRRSARQRVILYLLADGHTVADLVRMTVERLRARRLPTEIAVARDEFLAGRTRGPAFRFEPSRTPLPHNAFYRIVRSAACAAVGYPMSQEGFRAHIQSGHS